MSERWITIPPPAEFRDPRTGERISVTGEDGEVTVAVDREFAWFMHVYMLSHLQFSMDVGGYDASKAAEQIAKSMKAAMDKEEPAFAVTADQWRRLNCCITQAEDKHSDERLKPKPNPKILAMSSHGMQRQLDNFSASCLMKHLDAIANASTNKPDFDELSRLALPPAQLLDEATN